MRVVRTTEPENVVGPGGGGPAVRPRVGRWQRGQSAVELALFLPVLLLLLVTAIDLGRAYFTYTALENAVRAGASYATAEVRTISGTDAERRTWISNLIIQQSNLTPAPTVTFPTTPSPTIGVGVTEDIMVTYTFRLMTPLARSLAGGDLTLRYRVTITYT